MVKTRDKLLSVWFRHKILHRVTYEFDVPGTQTCHQSSHITPLTHGIVHRHCLRKYFPGSFCAHDDMRMDNCTIEIARNRQLNQVQRFISPDEHNSSHNCRSSIVGVEASAGQVFTFHCANDDFLLSERTTEKFIHSESRSCRRCCTGTYTRTGIYFFANNYIDLGFLIDFLKKRPHNRRDDIVFNVFRKGHTALVRNAEPVSLAGSHFQDIPHLVQCQTDYVKTTTHIGNRCRGKHSNLFHFSCVKFSFGTDWQDTTLIWDFQLFVLANCSLDANGSTSKMGKSANIDNLLAIL